MHDLKKYLFIVVLTMISVLLWGGNNGIYLSYINQSINSHIHKIYQDKTGYIWFCTDNGLSRYNGSDIKTYYHEYGDSTSLMTNSVLTILEDSRNNFWVGTTEGLQRFDRKTDTFEAIKFSYPHVNDFSYINSIIEDRKGNIWLATSRAGAICLKADTYQPTYYMPVNSNICSNKINTIFEDKFGNIWIGSHDNGISVINSGNGMIINYVNVSGDVNTLSSNKIFTISSTPDGNILIGSIDSGIDLFDYSTRRIIRNYIPDCERVYTLENDKNKILWIGTDGKGIKQYNYNTKQTTGFDSYSPLIDMREAKIHSIIEDVQGNIWLGLYQKGVMVIPSNEQTFRTLGFNPFYTKKNIGKEPVLAIIQDSNGDFLFGTDGDGIYKLDSGKNVRKHYNADLLKGQNVVTLFQDSKGRIWAGTYLSGLYRYHPEKDLFLLENFSGNGVELIDINVITEDNSGNLWIGTNSDGVCVYTPGSNQMQWLKHDIQKTSDQLLSNAINTLYLSASEQLWIGTSSAGFNCYNIKTGTYTDFTTKICGLSNDCINAFTEDKSGNLWVGTKNGLNCLESNSNEIKTIYTKSDGLPDASINGLEIDENNNLWISTSMGGLAFLNTATGEITGYVTPRGGDMNGEFKRGAHCRSTDGELLFGGIGGVVYFQSFTELPAHSLLGLAFTDLYIYNTRVEVNSDKNSILKDDINNTQEITLNYNTKSFSISFGAIEYTANDKVIYQVRMDNFDKEWKTVSANSRIATYTNIPPGEYIFRVRASLSGNNPQEKSLKIIITPPLWKTWWAMIIYVLLFLTAGSYAYYIIKKKEIKRRENIAKANEARIMQSKLQFFTDISHEIRTPLTLILSPIEQLIKEEKNERLLKLYKLMFWNAHRILRLVNQTMDMRKIDRGKVVLRTEELDVAGFIENIISSFSYMAEDKNITLTFNVGQGVSKAWVDPDIMDKVLVNVISNAMKYTPQGGCIKVLATSENNSLLIHVSDTGIGIPHELRESVFNRFFRIPNEDNKVRTGTGIGLHLSLNLMIIHHGDIYIEDTDNGIGTRFIIRIPLNDIRLKPMTNAVNTDIKASVIEPLIMVEQTEEIVQSKKKHKT